jgi:hypothetical protein
MLIAYKSKLGAIQGRKARGSATYSGLPVAGFFQMRKDIREKLAFMKKTKALIIAFSTLLVSTLALTVATFAWFTSYHQVQTINVMTGSLSIGSPENKIYKYVYPFYSDQTTLIDYGSAGTVTSFTPTVASPNVEMNIFDPTYITIVLTRINHPTTAHSQADVSLLNTNLVIGFSFSVTYTTPIEVEVSAKRNSSFTHDPNNGSFGVSHYLNYFGLSSTAFAAAGGDATKDTSIFDTVKSVAENAENLSSRSTFTSDASDASLTFFEETLVDSDHQPSAATTSTFTFYVNVDYQDALCDYFYGSDHLGRHYALSYDYSLYMKISEVLA